MGKEETIKKLKKMKDKQTKIKLMYKNIFIMLLPKNVDRNTHKHNEDATNADHGK